MAYRPVFTLTPRLLALAETIAVLRERILAASVQVAWIPSLQSEARVRTAHGSTAIEGNPLTIADVRALAEGRDLPARADRHRREVLNYFAGLRLIEQYAGKKRITQEDILGLHAIIAGGVMHQGRAGEYRTISVSVGFHVPPPPEEVAGLMREYLEWWNSAAGDLSPVISSSILHSRFEDIHPFADGNGRTGRAIALWELYRRGFDTHHIFSVDEYFWNDRPGYYVALDSVRRAGGDLTEWLEYAAEGIRFTLDRVWKRIQDIMGQTGDRRITLQPRQETLLRLLEDRKSLAPNEIWSALGITRQGAAKLIKPLLEAGLIRRVGGKKTGRYILGGPVNPRS
jgi:Fic family protein